MTPEARTQQFRQIAAGPDRIDLEVCQAIDTVAIFVFTVCHIERLCQ